jgi:hypothetical protein
VPTSTFYDDAPLCQIAINLFHGWGYNFYRRENQLRADDQLVRSQAGWLLGSARASVEAAESEYRRERIPPPSREKPRPDPEAVAGAQTLERLSKAIGRVQGVIAAQPVPENDRMTQRYRLESETLLQLVQHDQRLVGRAELLRSMVDQKKGDWLLANNAVLTEGIAAIEEALRARMGVLHAVQ